VTQVKFTQENSQTVFTAKIGFQEVIKVIEKTLADAQRVALYEANRLVMLYGYEMETEQDVWFYNQAIGIRDQLETV
jgi:hypothetical protein